MEGEHTRQYLPLRCFSRLILAEHPLALGLDCQRADPKSVGRLLVTFF